MPRTNLSCASKKKQFDVSKKDMSVKVARKTSTGDDNPLKQMIMKEFGIARGEVKKFVMDKGFDGLKGLAAAAKEKGVGIIEMLGGAPAAPAKEEKKK